MARSGLSRRSSVGSFSSLSSSITSALSNTGLIDVATIGPPSVRHWVGLGASFRVGVQFRREASRGGCPGRRPLASLSHPAGSVHLAWRGLLLCLGCLLASGQMGSWPRLVRPTNGRHYRVSHQHGAPSPPVDGTAGQVRQPPPPLQRKDPGPAIAAGWAGSARYRTLPAALATQRTRLPS
ncbi:hypothetical protein D3C71_1526000 [compost metagenome]